MIRNLPSFSTCLSAAVGAAGFGLRRGRQCCPPARDDELVLVAQRADQDAERRDGPDGDEDENRDVDAEAAEEGLSS
jgi:hypothetical protein